MKRPEKRPRSSLTDTLDNAVKLGELREAVTGQAAAITGLARRISNKAGGAVTINGESLCQILTQLQMRVSALEENNQEVIKNAEAHPAAITEEHELIMTRQNELADKLEKLDDKLDKLMQMLK